MTKGGYFFCEGLDDAIQTVRSDSYYRFELVHRVITRNSGYLLHPVRLDLKRLSNGQNRL